ncbi:MAG: threonine synthase [Gammaproteobacteria bacterium]
MKFISTRGGPAVSLEKAIMSGTAPDGGLYMPETLPTINLADVPVDAPINQVARVIAKPYFAGSEIEDSLDTICDQAFNFPAPVRNISAGDEPLSVLELFHGPTAAFKDFGARFLAATMSQIIQHHGNEDEPATIIVATSGDTGGAVAAAFHKQPGTRVVVLFPEGRVSPRQEHQLTCWGDNIISLAVRGEFDDCQRLAKELFANETASREHNLCSANSINVGRLLPQSVYYAKSSLDYQAAHGAVSNYIVPTGNLGNAFACAWAKQMGFPVGQLILATNANRTIPDYLESGDWQPRNSISTLANAMDVGNPSNMERLRKLWGEVESLRNKVRSFSISDDEIRTRIVTEFQQQGIAWCPHTATGFEVYRNLPAPDRLNAHWVIAATADAAKFESIVEPLIGEKVPVPPELAHLLDLPSEFDTIDTDSNEVLKRL